MLLSFHSLSRCSQLPSSIRRRIRTVAVRILLDQRCESVSYHHPLEEGLGRGVLGAVCKHRVAVSYHHPLEEGLGQMSLGVKTALQSESVTIIH